MSTESEQSEDAAMAGFKSSPLLDLLSQSEKSDFGECWEEAVSEVKKRGRASHAVIQRKCRIGYNKANRILQKMEDLGYVGPEQWDRPRDIFI